MSSKKSGKGRKSSSAILQDRANASPAQDIVGDCPIPVAVETPAVETPVVEQSGDDVIQHSIAAGAIQHDAVETVTATISPAIVATPATVETPADQPKPIKLSNNGHETARALVRYVLDCQDDSATTARTIRALAASITKTNKFGEFAEFCRSAGSMFTPSALRSIALKRHYDNRFALGGLYATTASEDRQYQERYPRVVEQLVATYATGDDSADTLATDVPEFTEAQRLAAE